MARELGAQGVRVNMVMPDVMKTQLGNTLIAEQANRAGVAVDRVQKRLKNTHSLRRLAKPDEVTDVIDFLLSPDSAVITGQAIDVTCGAF